MTVCNFIILSSWIFLVNLFVEIVSLSFKTRLGFDFRGTAIALPVLALMDLIAIIATFKLGNRQKVSRKLIVGLFCMVFLVKFGIVVMLIAVNGHVLTEHWVLMPYNSRTLVAFIELICNNLTFIYHFAMSLVLLQPIVLPRLFDKKNDRESEKLLEPEFYMAQPQEEIHVKEMVEEKKRELNLSTISKHLSEKSEVKPRISQEFMDDHEVDDQKSDVVEIASKNQLDETTIAMTPSSWKSTLVSQASQKSMFEQSLENKAKDQSFPDAIETVEEYEARIQGNRD